MDDLNLELQLIKISDNDYVLTEEDFYPPEDKRLYCSKIRDIRKGDTFDDYVEWFWDNYESEIFDV